MSSDTSTLPSTICPVASSFVDVPADSHFSIHNLPYGVFSEPASTDKQRRCARIGIAIGDFVFDVASLSQYPHISSIPNIEDTLSNEIFQSLNKSVLNAFMALGKRAWRPLRHHVASLLASSNPALRDSPGARARLLIPLASVELHMPALIGDYTDFYASKEHATNVGTMFRGADNALNPNWLHIPIGYHGRSSSIIKSGQQVQRPSGQTRPDPLAAPIFGPSKKLDYELEMALLIGGEENKLGTPVKICEARERAFGLVLMNDWSARDIQAWEYVPLGPFLGKSFATTISPWVVTMDALEPFLVPGPKQEPEPLPYLRDNQLKANYDIQLEVGIKPAGKDISFTITRSNTKSLYWSFIQQLTHHASNGCNLRAGDLLGSGTISGLEKDSFGSMLELSWNGKNKIDVGSGQQRTFLCDGDTVTMTAWCQGPGYRVGFGNCSGTISPCLT